MSKIKTIRSLIDEVVDLITFTDDVVSTVRGKSYADTNRLAQLEPFCIYSRDLSNEDYLGEIQQLGLSIFVSYYLLAVETVADVDRAEVVKVLSAVNPDVGLESYSHSLVGLNELPIMSMEAKGSGGNRGGNRGGNQRKGRR